MVRLDRCLGLSLALLVLCGCGDSDPPGTSGDANRPPSSTPGSPMSPAGDAVTVEIKSWEETLALIASHQGKVVIVDLWSTSCEPCMREFPNLVALHKKFGSDKIACISVACDYEGLEDEPPASKTPQVLEFLKATGASFQNVLLSEPDIEVWEKIKLAAIPAVYVYGPDGKQARRFDNDANEFGDEGFTYKDHIVPLVESLLPGDATTGQ